MRTSNDDEDNEIFRKRRRDVKNELKLAKSKVMYQIKYSNPNPYLEDVAYLYKEGVNTKQLN